ncbi:MAG: 6-carboxytetrahydropterin synthase [Chloroflexi bacterium]|nr:6-carboxytetrahydropterin synthase [Chloroflexota bacterium]
MSDKAGQTPKDRLSPSSENIALVVFERLQEALGGAPVKLAQVQVWESPENAVTYRP